MDTENTFETTGLSQQQKDWLYGLYLRTYCSANEQIWYHNSDDLFKKYRCMVRIVVDKHDNTIGAFFFQKIKYGNKISLLLHNGIDDTPYKVLAKIAELLKSKGWFLEAAKSPGWLLRKDHNTPIIDDVNQIKKILEIDSKPNEDIVMNNDFKYDNKLSYQYLHTFNVDEHIFQNEEILFGTSICESYDDPNTCNRTCLTGGGNTKCRYIVKYQIQ